MLYRSLIRPLLFRLDAETAHHLTFAMLRTATRIPGMMPLIRLDSCKLPPRTKTLTQAVASCGMGQVSTCTPLARVL